MKEPTNEQWKKALEATKEIWTTRWKVNMNLLLSGACPACALAKDNCDICKLQKLCNAQKGHYLDRETLFHQIVGANDIVTDLILTGLKELERIIDGL